MLQWQDGKQVNLWPREVANGKLKFPPFIKIKTDPSSKAPDREPVAFRLLRRHGLRATARARSMLFWQILIDGFAISSLYALGATGFTLIFGVSGVLNLSHGAIMVAAAVAAWAAGGDLGVGSLSRREHRRRSSALAADACSPISSWCARCSSRARSARRRRRSSSSRRRCSGAS